MCRLPGFAFGHVKLAEKMCEIGQRPDPYCRVCQVPEDVTHYLMICPAQKQLQDRLRKTCKDNRRPYNLKTVLTCDSCTDMCMILSKQPAICYNLLLEPLF